MRPGSEEYLDSEKFQLRPRDWAAAEAEGRSLAPYLTRLNEMRRAHPALQRLRNLRFHRDRQRPDHLLLQEQRGPTAGRATPCSWSSTSIRTGPARRRCGWTCRHWGWSGTTPWPCTTRSAATPTSGARPTTCAWTRSTSRRTCSGSSAGAGRRGGRSMSVEPASAPRPTVRDHSDSVAIDNFADLPDEERDPHWYKRAVFYEVLVRSFKDSNGDGTGDLLGLMEKLDYLQWLGVDCIWLPPFFRSPLRDGGYDVVRLHRRAAGVRHHRRLRGVRRRRARARHPGDHRLRHEPHVRPAPVVPGVPDRPGRPVRRLLRVGRHRRGLRRRADHLRRHRVLQLDLRPGPQAVLLAPLLQPPARPQLREPAGAGRGHRGAEVLARPRHRRLPAGRRALPVRGGGHQLREPPRHPRVPQAGAQGGRRAVPRPGACCARPTSGRATSSSTSVPGRRRVPDGLPLPGDAAAVHGRPPRVALPDLGDHGADAGDPGQLPVGHLPAQPRRADPGDGDRRGARLHVGASTPRTRA